MQKFKPTTGVSEADRLVGEIFVGDNVVLEANSGAPVDRFVSGFIASCERQGASVVYVNFNRSPQAISDELAGMMTKGRFMLVDCFSSGKGNRDRVFLDFFKSSRCPAIHVENPSDPAALQSVLARLETGNCAGYVFDSLTGMLDLWGDEEKALLFFGHHCPRLYDLNTTAFWLLETEAHTSPFLAKVRHVTQVVLEISVSQGVNFLTARKAVNRSGAEIGIPQRFIVEQGSVKIVKESREGRELGLLTRIGEMLANVLDPNVFFEGIMHILAGELGMMRGTLVFRDESSEKLRIVGAYGLSAAERVRGEYALGEGITGNVVQSGVPAVIPDIRKEPRFLDRTVSRQRFPADPTAFICVPLKIDDEVVGALSADRPFADEAALPKDLRLLTIVGSFVSQVVRINRMLHLEKDELLTRDKQHLAELQRSYRFDSVIGNSQSMRTALATAATAARSRATLLVIGETGTGKELAANIVHYNSPRRNGPFVKVNCGALPDTLLESELFGHVKGAFTGALRDYKGRFEVADGGTLFLDEVSDMSSHLQVKLLRVLQERQFEPLGSTRTVNVDVRVVAATSKDLREEVRQGRFRQDLYYRLNVIPIHLPPLRERRGDIPPLIDHFLAKFNKENGKNVTKISRYVLSRLESYLWPGNIRELENCIERAVVMSPGPAILPALLPDEIMDAKGDELWLPSDDQTVLNQVHSATKRYCEFCGDLARVRTGLIRTVEGTIIRCALERGLTQSELAARIGMSRMTLRKKIREYDEESTFGKKRSE